MTYPRLRHKLISFVVVASSLGGCDEKPKPPDLTQSPRPRVAPAPAPPRVTNDATPCPSDVRPKILGRVEEARLQEISGLVASHAWADLLWVHNDSGGQARVYAMTPTGSPIGQVELPLAARDWEDIALEPREGAPDRIYIADTGDNLAQREDGVFIHRFDEPTPAALRAAHPKSVRVKDIETMRVHFPNGPVDAEALLVDPTSGEMVLISKPRFALPEVYRIVEFSEEATLVPMGAIRFESNGHPLHLVTASDLSHDGRFIVLRTYDTIVVFERKEEQSLASALLGLGCSIKPAHENQGEAVGFFGPKNHSFDVDSGLPPFVTVGEGPAQPIYAYERPRPQHPKAPVPRAE